MAKIPKYKITIDEEYAEEGQDLGIDQIAFTANPAILVKGMAFKSAVETKKLSFTDEVKMRIAAPALIPMDIYRADEDGEYYVQFTVEEIEKIHGKFMQNLVNTQKFNEEHDKSKEVPAYVLEAWIVENPKEDKAYSTFGIEVPKGTLFVVSQVTDKDYYNRLVKEEMTGFSIEGFLGLKLSQIVNKNKQTQMKKKLFSKTERPKFKFAKIADINVWNIDVDQDTFEVGTVITTTWTDSAGTSYTNPISDGQYYTEDGGSIFVDVTGKVVLVQPAAEAAKPADAPEVAVEETATSKQEKLADTPKGEVADKEKTEEVKAAEGDVTPEAEPVDETPADEKADEAQILAIVQPKLEEIYKMIADLKAEVAKSAGDKPVEDKPVEMSSHERFTQVMKFLRDRK